MLKYPLYEAIIGGLDEGILQISLVDKPAVASNWEAFAEIEPEKQMYSVEDEEKRIITGCFLRADYPILRRNRAGEYYYITFSKDTIKTMVMKWMAEGRQNLINQDHQEGSNVDEIYLQEVYIKDTEKGISPKGFEEVEDGSAFATYKVLNDEVWEKVKNGEFKGYSIECITEMAPVAEPQEKDEDLYDEIIEMLEKITNKTK